MLRADMAVFCLFVLHCLLEVFIQLCYVLEGVWDCVGILQ